MYICQNKSQLNQSSDDNFARKPKRTGTNLITKTHFKTRRHRAAHGAGMTIAPENSSYYEGQSISNENSLIS